jgi:hypothetical protein
MSHKDDILAEYVAVRKAHGTYSTLAEWAEYVSLDQFTEFNSIFPVLLQGRDVIAAVKGARFDEPSMKDGSYFNGLHATVTDTSETRVYGDTIVTVTTGQTEKVMKDGTIKTEIVKSTSVVARVNGKLMIVHAHNSAPGTQSPPYHEKDQFW